MTVCSQRSVLQAGCLLAAESLTTAYTRHLHRTSAAHCRLNPWNTKENATALQISTLLDSYLTYTSTILKHLHVIQTHYLITLNTKDAKKSKGRKIFVVILKCTTKVICFLKLICNKNIFSKLLCIE